MSSDFTYTLQVPRTSLRVTVSESTDARAWEPLDRGDWDGDAALEAVVSAHSHAIYWTVFEVLNQLAGALMPGALGAIEQQKRGA